MAEEKDKQKLARPVLLRPHHGMCLSDELQKGMDVQLYVGTDEICSACPNNREGQCTDLTLVEKYDNAVLEACGLADGEQLAFDDFTEKVQNQLLVTGKRKEICGGCKWNGICENEKSRWEK